MYNDPISHEAVRADIGLDGVLNELKSAFSEISWLNGYVFLRAYSILSGDVSEKQSYKPQVYVGNGEYYDAFFNDNLPACLFFTAEGDEIISLQKPKNYRAYSSERQVSLIFSGDLKRIDAPYKADYIYTEAIKKEFIDVLAKTKSVASVDKFIDDRLEDVWKGYSIPNEKRVWAKYPLVSFRIDFTVKFTEGVNC